VCLLRGTDWVFNYNSDKCFLQIVSTDVVQIVSTDVVPMNFCGG
jgi:hypothetical protein